MSLISQISRTRQIDGCLTPTADAAILKLEPAHPKSPVSAARDTEMSTDGSDNSDIPSPPMSPNAHSVDLVVPRAAHVMTRSLILASETFQYHHQRPAAQKKPFPVANMANTALCINPFQDMKQAGFRTRQFSFLSYYHLNQAKPAYIPHSPAARTRTARSGIRSSYNTVSKARYESSSDSDRPRTRKRTRSSEETQTPKSTQSPLPSHSSASPSPSPKRRRRKLTTRKANSATTRYDYDYTKFADCSPALSTLPDDPRCLRTEWKGQSMDLADDPLVSVLHPAEVLLASTLRLPCKVYLDSKRRIFAEKVRRLKIHLPFRRTDAQKACKIDVNKASRLYAAFEKVGWFNEKHFTQYL